MTDTRRPSTSPGVMQRLLGSLLGLLHAHMGLLGVELEEARERILRMVVLGMLGAGALLLCLQTVMIGIIVLADPSWRPYAVGTMVLVFLLMGLGCIAAARKLALHSPTPFAATLDELKRDKERLLS